MIVIAKPHDWTDCLGNEISNAEGCSPCCWNTCRKRGEGDGVWDNDYGFCKDSYKFWLEVILKSL